MIEGEFKCSRGIELHTYTLLPEGEPKAVLVFHHGFSDHSQRHAAVLSPLTEMGIAVMTYDMHGHGRSGPHDPNSRNIIKDFNHVVDDLLEFVDKVVKKKYPTTKLFVMGHSLGGCTSALAACRRPGLFSAVVLSSPMVGVLPPGAGSSVTLGVMRTLNAIGAKGLRVGARRPVEADITDEAAQKELEADTLWDRKPYTLGTVISIANGCCMLAKEAPAGLLDVPLYIQQGNKDVAAPHEWLAPLLKKIRAGRHQKAGRPAPGGKALLSAGDDGSGVVYYEVEGAKHDLDHDVSAPECHRRIRAWLQAQL